MSTPHVVFIHGLWVPQSAWRPWQDLFESHGYTTSAPGYPGEADTVAETREHPDSQAGNGIDDLVAGYAAHIAELPAKPIAIGHSFGGLIAQKLLGQDLVSAAIAIDPAPVKGVTKLPFTQLWSALPILARKSNVTRAVMPTQRQFRYGFGNAISREESDALWQDWVIPSPARPLFEAASAKKDPDSPATVDVANADRGPLLFLSGTADHTVPDAVSQQAFSLYASSDAVTEMHRIDGRGHSLTLDSGWPDVAGLALSWLGSKSLAPA